jgi:sRNA-binding carbon storage regulator CsrA
MLILTIKAKDGPIHLIDKDTNEKIGEVLFLGFNRGEARLGFEMDDFVKILRHKLYERENNNG